MPYEVGFKPAALRQLRKLDTDVQIPIIAEIEFLGDNPRASGCKSLRVKLIYIESE